MKRFVFISLIVCFSVSFNTYSQNKTQKETTIDFNKPFQSLGFSMFNGINFAPKLNYSFGEIEPILYNAYVPEFILQYNYMIKNGFGIALEVPFGIFLRKSLTKLPSIVSNYAIPSNHVMLEIGSQYIGFTCKLFVFKELNTNVCMQGELGIKFNPFYSNADQWDFDDYDFVYINTFYDTGLNYHYPIKPDNSSMNFPKIEQKYYYVPDATASLTFFFHSERNPKKNLAISLIGNLSFVQRIKINYDTYFSRLRDRNLSWGSYGWNSSAIGISFGYRFMGLKP